MLPVRDDNPQVDTPIATYVLIGLNVLAWFFLQGFGDEQTLRSSVQQFGLKPGELFSNEHYTGQWSELISSMFMHGSWMHIIGNMWFLWIFGDNIEDSMGSVRFVVFYLLSGLAAAAAQIVSDTSSMIPMVGASGAIGGVMGAYIVLYPKVKVHMLVFIMIIRVPAIAMLGYWMGVQLIGGVSSIGASGGGTAFWAHVGGFAAGAILVWFFKDEEMLLNHPYYGWKQRANPADIWQDPSNRQ
ncbi:MAG: rhomboid family intramembrane serine protease [Arenicella sp.]|nr:rhomboid family intramembrane serine protease [Arenicella sp.]